MTFYQQEDNTGREQHSSPIRNTNNINNFIKTSILDYYPQNEQKTIINMNQHHTQQSIQQQSHQTNDQTNVTEIPNSIRLIRSDTLNNTNPEKKT